MPNSAVISGSPIASSEPKLIRITITAASTPTPSLGPPGGCSTDSTASPPRVKVTPSPDACFTLSSSGVTVSAEIWSSLDRIVAYAVCRSAEICPGVRYGSAVSTMCGAPRRVCNSDSTRVRTAGSVTGCCAVTASVRVSPFCFGKCCRISSCACADSLVPPEKSLSAGAA
nr:hypothetical protein [Actinocatenispora sera]